MQLCGWRKCSQPTTFFRSTRGTLFRTWYHFNLDFPNSFFVRTAQLHAQCVISFFFSWLLRFRSFQCLFSFFIALIFNPFSSNNVWMVHHEDLSCVMSAVEITGHYLRIWAEILVVLSVMPEHHSVKKLSLLGRFISRWLSLISMDFSISCLFLPAVWKLIVLNLMSCLRVN